VPADAMDGFEAEEAVAVPVLSRILFHENLSTDLSVKILYRLANQEKKRINKSGKVPDKPWQTDPILDLDKQSYILTCEAENGDLWVKTVRLVKIRKGGRTP
jgi:hypothetical protein